VRKLILCHTSKPTFPALSHSKILFAYLYPSRSFANTILTFFVKDYFAEMAKSDEHMGKVKANLLTQKDKIDQRDKARQLRQQKKFAKDVQKKAKLKKQEDRRVAKEEIKMIRKKGEKGLTQPEGGFNQGVKKTPMKKVNIFNLTALIIGRVQSVALGTHLFFSKKKTGRHFFPK